jgi:hypothetical protein
MWLYFIINTQEFNENESKVWIIYHLWLSLLLSLFIAFTFNIEFANILNEIPTDWIGAKSP